MTDTQRDTTGRWTIIVFLIGAAILFAALFGFVLSGIAQAAGPTVIIDVAPQKWEGEGWQTVGEADTSEWAGQTCQFTLRIDNERHPSTHPNRAAVTTGGATVINIAIEREGDPGSGAGTGVAGSLTQAAFMLGAPDFVSSAGVTVTIDCQEPPPSTTTTTTLPTNSTPPTRPPHPPDTTVPDTTTTSTTVPESSSTTTTATTTPTSPSTTDTLPPSSNTVPDSTPIPTGVPTGVGEPETVGLPVWAQVAVLFLGLFIGSLGTLAWTEMRARRR